MLPFEWRDMRSLRDRFLSWFYPNRGWSADLHEAPRAPAATESEADAAPPETAAGCGARSGGDHVRQNPVIQ